jgi:kynureninase
MPRLARARNILSAGSESVTQQLQHEGIVTDERDCEILRLFFPEVRSI